MLKKSTLLSVSVFFLLFIGVSDYGYACHKGPGSTDGGGCGRNDGGGSKPFKVHLAGAFVFDTLAGDGVLGVVLNEKGNTARSPVGVEMSRPDDELEQEQMTWDGVFGTCPVLLGFLEGLPVESAFTGADDWRISINTGEIRLKFPHMLLTDLLGDIEEVDLQLQLIGDLDLNVVDLPPAPGSPIEIWLDRFDIRGPTVQGIHPRERCVLDIMSFPPFQSPILTICADEDDSCHPPE